LKILRLGLGGLSEFESGMKSFRKAKRKIIGNGIKESKKGKCGDMST